MYSRILVATDGSEYSDKAVQHAIDLAKSFGAELIVISVVNMESVACIEEPTSDIYCQIQEKLEKRANDILDGVEKKATRENLLVKKIVQTGDTAAVTVELAKREGADLIVVGTRGLLGVKRVTLGSSAEKIVRWAEIPVLVVR
ncbi:MAG: universal stress protein [Candidatus Jordarchaeum sp.]|uniref:universal stress protein n=1 Tax=Candidatus Jordarchaeum sp. TaxID=2823881 RepID=UPI00404926AC